MFKVGTGAAEEGHTIHLEPNIIEVLLLHEIQVLEAILY